MLQELCRKCYGWDDNIPADISHQWTRWLDDLKGLTVFRFERCIKPRDFGPPIKVQLHNFSDAIVKMASALSLTSGLKKKQQQVPCFLPDGKSKSYASEEQNHSLVGAHSGCPGCTSRPNVESRVGAAAGAIDFLDLHNSSSQIHKKQMKTSDSRPLLQTKFQSSEMKVLQWRYEGTKDYPADCASRDMRVGNLPVAIAL